MPVTPQDVSDQLSARIKLKRDNLSRLPDIPTLVEQRAKLAGEIEGLSQALAMVQRLT